VILKIEKNGNLWDFQSQQFRKDLRKLARFIYLIQVGSQKYGGMLIFQNFHVWFIAIIWLNLPMVDCQFGYITKLTKKITGGPFFERRQNIYGDGHVGICLMC
jgi:hypothetical protein